MNNLRLRWRNWRWERHWDHHNALRAECEFLGLTPRPPDATLPGERAPELDDRRRLLVLKSIGTVVSRHAEVAQEVSAEVFAEFERRFGPIPREGE